MKELRLFISDILLLWSFKILKKSEDKDKMANILMYRYGPKRYRFSIDPKDLDDIFKETPLTKEGFYEALYKAVEKGRFVR